MTTYQYQYHNTQTIQSQKNISTKACLGAKLVSSKRVFCEGLVAVYLFKATYVNFKRYNT